VPCAPKAGVATFGTTSGTAAAESGTFVLAA
jgi:hypothetical protein